MQRRTRVVHADTKWNPNIQQWSDVCEKWEHVECVRRPDRIEERLYTALMASPSKALLFCCTACRRKSSIVKQLYKLRYIELLHLHGEV